MKLTFENLKKKYDGKIAVSVDHLEIGKGELVGLAGNNGAGKTTLLRLILDLIQSDEGRVLNGELPVHESNDWKKYTGSFLDEGFLIGFLKPMEFFKFNAKAYGISRKQTEELLDPYKRFLGNDILENKKMIRQLSTGNKQKTGIVSAMMVNPEVLLLDEPFNFLDPSSQIIISNLLKWQHEKTGSTMMISSHNIDYLSRICTRILLLEEGVVVKDIPASDEDGVAQINDYFTNQANWESL